MSDRNGGRHTDRASLDRETYNGYLVSQELADNSIRNYSAMYVRWHDWALAHGHNPHRPDPLAVRGFSNQLSGSRSLKAHARSAIKHLCAALEVDDVSAAIPLPRQPGFASKALPPEDTERLLEVARGHGLAGLAVLVGLYTGARRSEIASLAWERIDFALHRLTLQRMKTRDYHMVPMHPTLEAILYDRWVPGETWVFPGKYGGHTAPAMVWEWVKDVGREAGLGHLTPHVLRHTCLTEANEGTRDLRAVQELAGHTDPAITARYTRASDTRMRAAVAALGWGDAADGA